MAPPIGFALLCAVTAMVQSPAPWTPPGPNIARGRPYTLSPAPNYALCTDPDDAVQLTDGVYTDGYFWTQKSTVGWQSGRPVLVTVDLGRPEPIIGASFSTAAGVAGVAWPAAIDVYVSDDRREWWPAGDLVPLGGGPPAGSGYATHRFRTDRLRCHGRYVAFQVDPGSEYCFCDEIEVFRGPDALAAELRTGAPVTDLRAEFVRRTVTTRVRGQIMADAADVRRQIEAAKIADSERARLLARLDSARAQAAQFTPSEGFRAAVPYCPAHASVIDVRAALWRAGGIRPTVWGANPWDPLDSGDLPPLGRQRPAVDMVMLRNEIRSAALNITNPGPTPLTVRIRDAGLPAGAITVREALFTGAKAGGAVASALPAAEHAGGSWAISVPAGMTRQAWISVNSASLTAGRHRGSIVLTANGNQLAQVPVSVQVARIRMPSRMTLSLGGWDYTDAQTYGVTAGNLAQVVAFLKLYNLDAPWANAGVMPFGKHEADGRMAEPPDTRQMDRWLDRWGGARTYFVFNSFGDELPDTPAARRRVKEWIDFWVRHLEARGIRATQLGLLLVDEPHEAKSDRTIVSYARVIRDAQPGVVIFEDPIWQDPRSASPDLYAVSTMLCPNRVMWMGNRKLYEDVFLAQRAAGKKLAFYSCSGPVRSLDPYSYHRLQAWDCFRYGAVHEGFWAFGDTGGGTAWNEFAAPGTCFCPEFLGPDGCTTSKHMEAIREGLYDYETLTLLRRAVERAARAGRHDAAAAEARRLLEDGPRRVTEAKGAESIKWSTVKDRSVADTVRRRAIDLLERL